MNKQSPRFLPFDDAWKMRIDHPYSLIVRDGDLLWSCGQCPLDPTGLALHLGDLLKQATAVAGFIRRYLTGFEGCVSNIARLVVYYVKTGTNDAEALIDLFRLEFGGDVLITPVPVPFFYYEDMLIEVDVFGTSSNKMYRRFADRETGIELELVDAGSLIWVTLAARELPSDWTLLQASLQRIVEAAGLCVQNLLCSQWFVADNAALDLVDAATGAGLARNGAVKIDFDGYRALAELTFCNAPVSHRAFAIDASSEGDRSVEINFSQSENHFSIDARNNDSSRGLVAQTEAIMEAIDGVLKASGLHFGAVRKSTAYYVAGNSADELHNNMSIRNRYYSKPGPASTGLPVRGLSQTDALISVQLTGRS